MEHKSFSLGEFKALGGDSEPGSFEAVAAVFGNVDAGGDRIERGAFKQTLGEWAAKGRSIPVLWSHDSESVPIGVIRSAREDSEGLRVKGQLLVDDHPQARAVYAAMKAGALNEFSFGYGVYPGGASEVIEGGRKVRVLKNVGLSEISPVFRGMNPSTRLVGVKSAAETDLQGQKDAVDRQITELQEQSKQLSEAIASLDVIPDQTSRTLEVEITGDAGVLTEALEAVEQSDKPDPNPTGLSLGEEDAARINRLLAERPIYTQETP